MGNLLLLDFDGTITQHDTLNTLTEAPPTPPREPPEGALLPRWKQIVQSYIAAHTRHSASYSPRAAARTTLAEELDYLESVRPVEAASVAQVGEAGLFSFGCGHPCCCALRYGVGYGYDEEGCAGGGGGRQRHGGGDDGEGEGEGEGATTVTVRKGFGEFVRRMGGSEGGWEVAVVSVNWSGEFIRGVVEAGCGQDEGEKEVIETLVSNSIAWPGGYVRGPRELGTEPLVTAGDKLRAMQSLTTARLGEGDKVVYFGDSTTDLACLVAADLGVVMADDAESKLLKTLERIGFDVPHVGDPGREGSKLVWARDFEEVLRSGVMDGRKPRKRYRM
ncbi:hypothetical protein C8A05DRAFT_14785 [Staphylotrichum tortipilum]|uniref:Uncharacterized protein n=1 Tax=Staphylotrichum tortipilum TaxID=2831512 RepID=A0AAN6RUQ5_9PEZI|nr:hypothetical protein C8A05DRAFT_14785 [Staphylotrichum longicolle]